MLMRQPLHVYPGITNQDSSEFMTTLKPQMLILGP